MFTGHWRADHSARYIVLGTDRTRVTGLLNSTTENVVDFQTDTVVHGGPGPAEQNNDPPETCRPRIRVRNVVGRAGVRTHNGIAKSYGGACNTIRIPITCGLRTNRIEPYTRHRRRRRRVNDDNNNNNIILYAQYRGKRSRIV